MQDFKKIVASLAQKVRVTMRSPVQPDMYSLLRLRREVTWIDYVGSPGHLLMALLHFFAFGPCRARLRFQPPGRHSEAHLGRILSSLGTLASRPDAASLPDQCHIYPESLGYFQSALVSMGFSQEK